MLGAVVVISFIAFTGHGLIRDPDFWWHIRTGEWIVQHNLRLPGHDIYTFWGNPSVWTDHEWLSEVGMWLLYSSTGALGIVVAFSLVTLAGLVFLILRSAMSRPPYLILGAGLLLGVVTGAPIWGPRPQMLEFCFVALELLWLARYLRDEPRGGLDPRHWPGIYWLPLLMIAWVNLHGSWPSAFLFLGAAIAAQAWSWLALKQAAAKRRVVVLIWVTALSVAALLLTPNGPAELLYPFQTQGSTAQQALIEEWFSPDFHQIFLRPFEVMLFVALVGFMAKRPNLYSSLLVLGTLAMSLQSVRHIALFILVATPALIDSYSRIWREDATPWLAKQAWGARLGHVLQPSPTKPASAVLVAVTWLVLSGFAVANLVYQSQGQAAFDSSDYPVAATNWLLSSPQDGMCKRIYNQYGWGGYMVYRLYGSDHQVYIFGEAALMGDTHLNQYEDVAIVAPDWQKILTDAGVDCVVYNRGTAIVDALAVDTQAWHRVYQDTVTEIYVRN